MKLIQLLFLLLVLTPASIHAQVIDIDNAQLRQLIAQNIPVVDVRTAPEWSETGVIEGSHLLTFFDSAGKYDARSWLDQLAPIADKDDPVILICRTGRRTEIISNFLDAQIGYKKIYNVTKGIRHWVDSGQPTVAPK